MKKLNFIDWLALLVTIIGALNWGLMGIIQKDLVMGIIGLGWSVARIVYIAVGVAGAWSLLFVLPKAKM